MRLGRDDEASGRSRRPSSVSPADTGCSGPDRTTTASAPSGSGSSSVQEEPRHSDDVGAREHDQAHQARTCASEPNSDRRVGRNPPCRTPVCRPRPRPSPPSGGSRSRPRAMRRGPPGTTAEVEPAVRRLSCVQLDSISTVERSHRIALGVAASARYPRDGRQPPPRRRAPDRVLGARGVPAARRGLAALPARDARSAGGAGTARSTEPIPISASTSSTRSAARGPLGSRHFDGAARQGEMWGWKPAKQMLELLWNHGDLVVAAARASSASTTCPSASSRRRCSTPRRRPSRSACASSPCGPCRPAASSPSAGIVEHWRLQGGVARDPRRRRRPSSPTARSSGLRSRTAAPPVLVAGGHAARPCRRRPAPVLLSPFDNLLWDRPFARRALGFDHLIEVYKPAHAAPVRLLRPPAPLARPDRRPRRPQVGAGGGGARRPRVPPRARRRAGSAALDDALDRALDRLRRVIGLETRPGRRRPSSPWTEARRLAVVAQLLDGRGPGDRDRGRPRTRLGAGRPRRRPSPGPSGWCSSAGSGPTTSRSSTAALDRGDLFEYWAHIVPTSDYGIHREAMRRYPRGDLTRARYIREWLAANAAFRRYVLRELRRRGPLPSRATSRTARPCSGGRAAGTTGRARPDARHPLVRGRHRDRRARGQRARLGPRRAALAARRAALAVGRGRPRRGRAAASAAGVARRERVRAHVRRHPPGAERAFTALVREEVAVPVRVRGSTANGGPTATSSSAGPGHRRARSSSPPSTGSSTTASARRALRLRLPARDVRARRAKREYGYYVAADPARHRADRPRRRHRSTAGRSVLRVDGVWAEHGAPADAGQDVSGHSFARAGGVGRGRTRFASARRVPATMDGLRSVPESVRTAPLRALHAVRGRLVDESRGAAESPSGPSSSTGSATSVLDTVRRLGFLQLDPIATRRARAASRAVEPAREPLRPGGARPAPLG